MSTTFWIQLLGVIFGSAMIYFTFVKFKRKELSSTELGVWLIGWIVMIFVAIVPSFLDFIIEPLNFHRRLDFFVVFGFFMLLGLGFYNYSVMKKIERKIEIMVRKEAIKKKVNLNEESKEEEENK